MTRPKPLTAIIAGCLVLLATATTPASACTTSTWNLIGGNTLAGIIKGRDCGGTYTTRIIGLGIDTGWIPMYRNGANQFTAQFGNGVNLTDVHMITNGATMTVNFNTKNSSGSSSQHGTYHLTGF
ncbi:MAG: hypothetical protein KDJ69_13605 [Nitratireductor sp.]|nr:hypothetical protein [Nitratireductor sp.]